jgi:NADH:ubiquinone oxidoreductase subunit 2 (subunit N)
MGAIYQIKLKRFLAYSAIANMDLLWLVLCIFLFRFVWINFLCNNLYMQTIIFLICLFFIRDNSTGFILNKIADLKTLVKSNKLLSYILAINLFSMAGLPPLIGFFSKFYIFSTLIIYNSIYTILFLIIMSCISTFYYVRITQSLFFNTLSKPKFFITLNYPLSLFLVILTFINIFFCCFPWLIMDIIYSDVWIFIFAI